MKIGGGVNKEIFDGFISNGNRLYELGQYESAIKNYSAAAELDPASAKARYNRGVAYEALGYYNNATEDYFAAVSLDPKFNPACRRLDFLQPAASVTHIAETCAQRQVVR